MEKSDSRPNPSESSSLVAYLQKFFGDEFEEIEDARKKTSNEALRRRFVAYTLKGIAVLGGLVLAAGLVPPLSQVLGFAITAAVAVDAWFSNHERLLTVTQAAQAYRQTLKKVTRTHRLELAKVIQLRNSGDPTGAEKGLTELTSRLLRQLQDDAEKIETALDAADLKSLKSLALDTEAAHT